MHAYFYGAIFIELHALTSYIISQIHRSFDWSEVFLKQPSSDHRMSFEFQEGVALISIWIAFLSLQTVIVFTRHVAGIERLALEVGLTGLCSLLLLSRAWYLGRSYFIGGLEALFGAMDPSMPSRFQGTLPLHSSPLLARFEATFNTLMTRLRGNEQEISHWIFMRAEESRYKALGEISALIAHDLSGPLHVIDFCTKQLAENPELLKNPRYLEQLTTSGTRSVELVDSLKAYLKNTTGEVKGVEFGEVYDHVLRLLRTSFHSKGFVKIKFKVDPRLPALKVNLPRAEFIHTLVNITSNSIENMISNEVESPVVELGLAALDEKEAIITIRDNGTGLSLERFEALTAFMFLPGQAVAPSPEGLGLRLVRRLIERSGATLSLIPFPAGERGTLFHLKVGLLSA